MNTPQPQSPERLDTHFHLPEFWDRSVVYFANLKSIFFENRDQTAELGRQVGEIDSYGGRLAPVIDLIYRGLDNTLVLEQAPDPMLLDYFREGLNLSLPRIDVMPLEVYRTGGAASKAADLLFPKRAKWADGYVTDSTLQAWAQAASLKTVSTTDGSRLGNNKTLLHRFLALRGMPIPETHIARDAKEARQALADLRGEAYQRAVLRAALGASGIGMLKVELDKPDRIEIPDTLFHEGPCLVQGWLEPGVHEIRSVSSPSVQLFLDESTVQMYDITDQILSEHSIHEGNHSPPLSLSDATHAELIRQAGEAGSWLHGQGYRGTASVDFIVVERERVSEPEVYVCEVNARITGATYPSVLARHLLPGGAWLMRNLRLEYPVQGRHLVELMDGAGQLFRAGDREGVVPINLNFGPDGKPRKGQFLCLASNVDQCVALLDQLVEGLPFRATHDRD